MGRKNMALKQPKLEMRWLKGAWLGRSTQSGEHVVATAEGVKMCRTVKSLPQADQSVEFVVSYIPKPEEDEDHEQNVHEPTELIPPILGSGDVQRTAQGTPGHRMFRALREFQQQMGLTPGCSACDLGAGGRKHSSACKQRRAEFLKRQQAAHPDDLEPKLPRQDSLEPPPETTTTADHYYYNHFWDEAQSGRRT